MPYVNSRIKICGSHALTPDASSPPPLVCARAVGAPACLTLTRSGTTAWRDANWGEVISHNNVAPVPSRAREGGVLPARAHNLNTSIFRGRDNASPAAIFGKYYHEHLDTHTWAPTSTLTRAEQGLICRGYGAYPLMLESVHRVFA